METATLNGKKNKNFLTRSRFWFPECEFGGLQGVIRTKVGYHGGKKKNPTYRSIGDHSETIQIDFDPKIISFEEILNCFWSSHFPYTPDKYRQYMSAIWYHSEVQKKIALKTSKEQPQTVYTVIEPFKFWTDAEFYHQKYILQGKSDVMKYFKKMSQKDFIESTITMKVNAIIKGHGTLEDLEVTLNNCKQKEEILHALKTTTQCQLFCSINKKK
eukprot:gene2675-3871_t